METKKIVSREEILDLLLKYGDNPVPAMYATWEEYKDEFFTKNHFGQDGNVNEDLHHEFAVLFSVRYTESVFPGLDKNTGDWPEEASKLCDLVYLQYTWHFAAETYVDRFGQETDLVNNPDLVWIGQELYKYCQELYENCHNNE